MNNCRNVIGSESEKRKKEQDNKQMKQVGKQCQGKERKLSLQLRTEGAKRNVKMLPSYVAGIWYITKQEKIAGSPKPVCWEVRRRAREGVKGKKGGGLERGGREGE